MEYPSNSHKSKADPDPEDKDIGQVTSEAPLRRKKPLSRQFKDTFIGGSPKGTLVFVLSSVLIPAAKDALAEAGSQGIERLIFGESKGKRPSSTGGQVSYNRMSRAPSRAESPRLSSRARAYHEFDELILKSRGEAESVVDRLFELVDKYQSASVADLYELVGLQSSHTDQTWGWTDLRGAGVARVRSGFLLDLPDPEPLR